MSKDNIVSKTTGIIIILSSTIIIVGIALIGIYIVYNHTDLFNDGKEISNNNVQKVEQAKEGKSQEEYDKEHEIELSRQRAGSLLADMNVQVSFLKISCDGISGLWQHSIVQGRDINEGIQQALDIQKESREMKREDNEDIEKKMKELSNPPERYQELYDLTLEAYGYYQSLYNHTVTPSGNYQTYLDSYNDDIKQFDKVLKKISASDFRLNISPYMDR